MVEVSSGPVAPVRLSAPGATGPSPFAKSRGSPGGPSVPGAPKGVVIQAKNGSADSNPNDKFDDDDYPAYSMGSAAQILGTTPGFLRSLDEAKLLTPQRSEGGHRRYSRYQLRIAARARELVDRGTSLDAACRIIILEDQLAEAHALNAELHRSLEAPRASAGDDASPR
jgi:DNA-binding transcriptional MerR regulator